MVLSFKRNKYIGSVASDDLRHVVQTELLDVYKEMNKTSVMGMDSASVEKTEQGFCLVSGGNSGQSMRFECAISPSGSGSSVTITADFTLDAPAELETLFEQSLSKVADFIMEQFLETIEEIGKELGGQNSIGFDFDL